MNETLLNEKYQEITRLIRRKQLKEALSKLQELLFGVPENWELLNEIERIETSYNYMLEYMRRGMKDAERKNLHAKLLTEALVVADHSRILIASQVSSRLYYMTRLQLKSKSNLSIKALLMQMEGYSDELAIANLLDPLSDRSKEIRLSHEEALENLFNLVWTNVAWGVQENGEALEVLDSPQLPLNDLCLFVSAVTMSLMACFDLRKLMWLFDAYGHKEVVINQRALVGLAFIFQFYHERLLLYPEVAARLSLLNEDERFSGDLCRVQIQILRSQETEKIDRKMREEIIPEMIKSVKNQNMKFDLEELDEEGNEYNPDWMQKFESSPIGDKLREMSELQMEGADVYMSTFAQLKGYPFFRKIANWFYPFDKQHSAVVEEFKSDKHALLDVVFKSAFFCESDKYSMCFTLTQIPQEQRDAMMSQLSNQQMSELLDDKNEELIKKRLNDPVSVSNLYIHALYRFFRLFNRRYDFKDVFRETIHLYKYTILQPILQKKEYLREIAEFLFRKEYILEATNAYESLLDLSGDDVEIYQKIGYCRQKMKHYQLAIEAYLKADLLKPDNVWTNRNLATCYRMDQQFDKALSYYRKVEEVKPDNPNILFHIGRCLAEQGKTEEALNYFFKLDFLENDSLRAWRAIGWCSFISKKKEQAMRYYQKAIELKPVAADYLNAGHVAWCSGDIEKAIGFYEQCVKRSRDKEEFLTMFHKDEMYLIMQGISEDDIPLMLDLL